MSKTKRRNYCWCVGLDKWTLITAGPNRSCISQVRAMSAKEADLNRCGFDVKLKSDISVWLVCRQTTIAMYKPGPLYCVLHIPLLNTTNYFHSLRDIQRLHTEREHTLPLTSPSFSQDLGNILCFSLHLK